MNSILLHICLLQAAAWLGWKRLFLWAGTWFQMSHPRRRGIRIHHPWPQDDGTQEPYGLEDQVTLNSAWAARRQGTSWPPVPLHERVGRLSL